MPPLSVLLVEGDTEEVFYGRVKRELLADCRIHVDCIEGLYNINTKVVNYLLRRIPDEKVRVYCCVDRETRYGKTPGLDLPLIRTKVKQFGLTHVLSVDSVVATQMLESWFFHDIEGIFRYVRVPRSQRNPSRWHPPEKYGKRDLQELFRRYGRAYVEGLRAAAFINELDIRSIAGSCAALSQAINLIRRRDERGRRTPNQV